MSFRHVHTHQNKISPNTGTLLNGVLLPKLLNSLFASWFLINLDFLLSHIAHFHNIIDLPLLVLEIFGSMFSVSFLHFKQYVFILYVYKLFFKNTFNNFKSLILHY